MQSALPSAGVDPFLNRREVGSLIGISAVTVWRRVKDGTLPKPVEIGGTRRWPQSEILAFIEKAKNARPTAA